MNIERKHLRSILVIDSGIGGLSICQSIMERDASLQLVYFADSAFFPYGLLDEGRLTQRLKYIVSNMLKQHEPELVVLACNTVSTLLLPELRALFNVPFVGVVPAIKPAAQLSKTRKIGLLATPATVRRPYIDGLITDFALDCQVERVGSNDLVVQAENLLLGRPVDSDIIATAIAAFRQSEIDTVVLGCTHFPLLMQQLNQLCPEINWIDSGVAVAKRVLSLLEEAPARSSARRSDAHQFYFSGTMPDELVFKAGLRALAYHRSFQNAQFFSANIE